MFRIIIQGVPQLMGIILHQRLGWKVLWQNFIQRILFELDNKESLVIKLNSISSFSSSKTIRRTKFCCRTFWPSFQSIIIPGSFATTQNYAICSVHWKYTIGRLSALFLKYFKVYQPYTKHTVSILEYTVSRLSVPFVKYSKVYQPYTKDSFSIPEYTVSRLSVPFVEYSKVYQPYTKHSVSIPKYTVSRLSVPFVKYSKVYQPYTKHSVSIPEYTVSRLFVFFRSIRESTFWHRGILFRILGRLGRLTVYSKILSRVIYSSFLHCDAFFN